jgi:hypothetical protein
MLDTVGSDQGVGVGEAVDSEHSKFRVQLKTEFGSVAVCIRLFFSRIVQMVSENSRSQELFGMSILAHSRSSPLTTFRGVF